MSADNSCGQASFYNVVLSTCGVNNLVVPEAVGGVELAETVSVYKYLYKGRPPSFTTLKGFQINMRDGLFYPEDAHGSVLAVGRGLCVGVRAHARAAMATLLMNLLIHIFI